MENTIDKSDIIRKWLYKISLTSKTVPEIVVKDCVKNNKQEFLSDCLLLNGDCSPIQIFNTLIDEVLKTQEVIDEKSKCGCYKNAIVRPGLSYYDNRRDRFQSQELVPYRGQFGLYS